MAALITLRSPSANEQALALCEAEFGPVVGDSILQSRIVHGESIPLTGEVEVEEVSALQAGFRRADEQVSPGTSAPCQPSSTTAVPDKPPGF